MFFFYIFSLLVVDYIVCIFYYYKRNHFCLCYFDNRHWWNVSYDWITVRKCGAWDRKDQIETGKNREEIEGIKILGKILGRKGRE